MSTSTISNLLNSITNPKSDDYEIANEIAKRTLTSCQFHSSPSNLNPSTSYVYANNPGIFSCSVSSRKSNDSQPVFCVYVKEQPNCPLYKPDFSVMRKVRSTADVDYYLSRFRSYDGTYLYRIYDNELNLYSQFKYTQIEMENDNLNLEAVSLFNKFLIDLSIKFTYQDVAEDAMLISKQKETNYYLKNLVFKE